MNHSILLGHFSCALDSDVDSKSAAHDSVNHGSSANADIKSDRVLETLRDYYISSHRAEQITGIDRSTWRSWSSRGMVQLEPCCRDGSTVYVGDVFLLLQFLTTPQAGAHAIRPVRVPIHEIDDAAVPQFRSPDDEANIRDLQDGYSLGAQPPPVWLFRHQNRLCLADGHRRLSFLKSREQDWANCYIMPGDIAVATWVAIRANQVHGKRLQSRAVRPAIKHLIASNLELRDQVCSGKIPVRTFAKRFGFDDSTVGRAFKDIRGSIRKPSAKKARDTILHRCNSVRDYLARSNRAITGAERTTLICQAYQELTQTIADMLKIGAKDVPAKTAEVLRTVPEDLATASLEKLNFM